MTARRTYLLEIDYEQDLAFLNSAELNTGLLDEIILQ
jgi:hypothetical protein